MTDNQKTITDGCYLVLAAIGCTTRKVPVASIAEARAYWNHFRETANGGWPIGARMLKENSGAIHSADGKLVGRVSYNGRVWDLDGLEMVPVE